MTRYADGYPHREGAMIEDEQTKAPDITWLVEMAEAAADEPPLSEAELAEVGSLSGDLYDECERLREIGARETAIEKAVLRHDTLSRLRRRLDAVESALATSSAPDAKGEDGWQLVPINPTAAMADAGTERIVREYSESDWDEAKQMAECLNANQIWAAMLAAAPPPSPIEPVAFTTAEGGKATAEETKAALAVFAEGGWDIPHERVTRALNASLSHRPSPSPDLLKVREALQPTFDRLATSDAVWLKHGGLAPDEGATIKVPLADIRAAHAALTKAMEQTT